jgi:hypothetical protein
MRRGAIEAVERKRPPFAESAKDGAPSSSKSRQKVSVPRSGVNDVVADGVEDQVGDGVEVELEHDIGAMSFGGVDADAKEGGDLLVAFPFGEKLEDFAFAGSETRAKSARGVGRRIVRFRGSSEAGGEVRLAEADRVNGGEENAVGVVLEDVAASAGFDDLLNEIFRFVHGEDEDLGVRGRDTNAAGGLHAVEERHTDIEDSDIGFESGGFFDGIATIGSFSTDFPAGAGF